MSINQVESVFQLEQNVQKEEKKKTLNLQVGWDTDIGGCNYKPNQDRKILVPFENNDGCLIGMADGHGTRSEEVADLCEKMMIEMTETKMDRILINPVEFLEFAFDYIHAEIIKTYTCGTTFSLIIILGKKMWIANVGDSTGMLCAKHPIFKNSDLAFEKDVAIPEKMYETKKADDDKLSNY